MAVSISAILLSGSPAPVQVVVSGVPAGEPYEVRGQFGLDSWPIPGGRGVSDGAQVVLVDSRAPLRSAVTYTVMVGTVTATSQPVTVPYPEKYVIQSLDGRQKVGFVWRDNGLPRDPYIDNAAFPVPGRRRPPIRFAPGGDGTGALEIRADRHNSEALHELLMEGRPLVVRTDGQVRDLKPVDIIMPTAAPSALFEGDGGISTQRIWQLSYLLVDDPEPDTVLGAATWDQFDEIYAPSTWDQFDAEWATQTWDQFDAEDWAQRL